MSNFYLLSNDFDAVANAPFAVAISLVIAGVDSRFRPGDVLKATTRLFEEGKTVDGAEPASYEMGRWGSRFMCDQESPEEVNEETYFAWVSRDFWDFEPNLTFYTKKKFMELFEDCCRNYITTHPERRAEFTEALIANGMSL